MLSSKDKISHWFVHRIISRMKKNCIIIIIIIIIIMKTKAMTMSIICIHSLKIIIGLDFSSYGWRGM